MLQTSRQAQRGMPTSPGRPWTMMTRRRTRPPKFGPDLICNVCSMLGVRGSIWTAWSNNLAEHQTQLGNNCTKRKCDGPRRNYEKYTEQFDKGERDEKRVDRSRYQYNANIVGGWKDCAAHWSGTASKPQFDNWEDKPDWGRRWGA